MLTVPLPKGDVEVSTMVDGPDEPWAALALAHGAGAGIDHPFLAGTAAALADAGILTLRFTFPYLEAGRRMPGPAAHATATWEAAMGELVLLAGGVPTVAAGKSYGGRMASMAAADALIEPDALVYLGYPLHPPGEPEKERSAHLAAIAAPQLFVAGMNDPFLQPLARFEEVVAACRAAEISWITGGGHSFEVKGAKRPADEVGAGIGALVAEWLRGVLPRS